MERNGRKVLIIGGGIAGLCTAVLAQKCGYDTLVLEMHDSPGGLATSWRRGDYTFETCLHWLLGSSQEGLLHDQWQQVCDIDKLTFVDPVEFVRVENEHGDHLSICRDADLLEEELLEHAPQDGPAIRRFTDEVRSLAGFRIPDPAGGWASHLWTGVRNAPSFPLLRRLSNTTAREYGKRFTDPLLKSFFGDGDMSQMSAIAVVLSLAWMNARNAGYAIGGSQALIHQIVQTLTSLGGTFRCGARVDQILVADGTATGVRLANGEILTADWIVSAADGHSTIYEMLGGRYTSHTVRRFYEEVETFPSYLQVSLGVAMDLSHQAPLVTRVLDEPLPLDPGTELRQATFRFFHFDPTFAPPGKTPVTSVLPTRNYRYWLDLEERDPDRYRAEKRRVAESVIGVLEKMVPGIRKAIEVVDVSTPATVVRCTGNWKGSMEGWFPKPGTGFRPFPSRLPGLRRFRMAGQWIMPGGGLPSGLMTAQIAVKAMCREDRVPFLAAERPAHDVRHWRLRTP